MANWLTNTAGAAEILGWSTAKVKAAAKSGELPYEQKLPGATGAYLFDTAKLEAIAAAAREVTA